MDPAMDCARKGNHARTAALLLLMIGAGLTQAGCAGGDAWRSGALWSRARAEPGYDLYAHKMAESRDPGKPKAALAANDKPDEPRGSLATADSKSRSRADEEVRVTLGRPESLRVLNDSDAGSGPGPILASAAEPRPSITPAPRTEPARVAPRPRDPEPANPPPAVVDNPFEGEPPRAVVDQPARGKADDDPERTLRRLLAESRKRLEAMSTYQVDIARVERVGSRLQPEEEALLSIRREPKAVRLEWPDGPNKGREVIYSAAIDARMMHVNMANAAIPMPRMSLPVDSPLALRNSRHAITEAGFDTILDNLTQQLEGPDNTPPPGGRLTYKGLQKPKELDQTCHLIQRITPEKEIWRVYLDTETLMPIVVTAHQADGELLERYTYTNLRANPEQLASVDAFDPDKRWGESKGLLSRMAKAAAAAAEAPNPEADETTIR